jgi:hypothetical protein
LAPDLDDRLGSGKKEHVMNPRLALVVLAVLVLGILAAAWPAIPLAGAAEPAPTPAASVSPAPLPPDFELVGSRIIGCCCAPPCPCRLNKKPMHTHGCDHTDAVHIQRGRLGEVDMAGVNYVIVGRGFGKDKAGNWTVVYVDDATNPAQAKALEGFLMAGVESWGPKAEHLAGKLVTVKRVPIRYSISEDKNIYACTIPGILELETAAIYNPGHKTPVVSEGILDAFGDRFVHADCKAHTYHDEALGYSWDLTGRQSNQADFTLTDERVAEGGIGWGCWTAHAEYGDDAKYQEELIQDTHPK